MRLFDPMRKMWLRRWKEEDEGMTVPVRDEEMPVPVEQEGQGGNGDLVDGRLITIKQPYSIAAEQYRVLWTRVCQLMQDKTSYVLAVTSSIKSEGKTFTSLNLAISIARDFDEKVLLIEGDLKNPCLHEYLKYPPGFGLTDVLEGKIDINSCSIQLFEGRLSVLLAGKTAGNTSKLLSSHMMQEILNSARGNFKYIIIDTPPIIPMVDINIYYPIIDGILLVIQAGKTPRSVVKRALSSLSSSEKIIGAVLNEVESNYSKYYYGTRYSY
ncbi:MAG: CpsD/CapB family tyrosine-protein kinase [Nitrospirae bacterium]|nr:CpsD/CapB family tyrosine-protein kinase [Nitrospirota bacterium]